MDSKETTNRRIRLKELINTCFEEKAENLLAYIEQRTGKRPNQGEISALQISKSFGDKKAKRLAEQIGMHARWFEFPPGVNLSRSQWMDGYVSDEDKKSILAKPSKFGSLAEEAASIIDAMPLDQQVEHVHFLRVAKLKNEIGGKKG